MLHFDHACRRRHCLFSPGIVILYPIYLQLMIDSMPFIHDKQALGRETWQVNASESLGTFVPCGIVNSYSAAWSLIVTNNRRTPGKRQLYKVWSQTKQSQIVECCSDKPSTVTNKNIPQKNTETKRVITLKQRSLLTLSIRNIMYFSELKRHLCEFVEKFCL